MIEKKKYDFLIIGGGIFGAYAALYLANKKYKICLIEKEAQLFTKASIVNQARLHSGYHYPRSIATAMMSDDNKTRFTEEHKAFINFQFEKYYAIDKFGSFTDPLQFERFCKFVNIKCERVEQHSIFNFDRIHALYKTTEYTFDPMLIAHYYTKRLEEHSTIDVLRKTTVKEAQQKNSSWAVTLKHADLQQFNLEAEAVINATYAASNAIHQLFGMPEINLMHEISEIALLNAPMINQMGLTVMDGQFGSIMPYGKSGFLSLSSVAYTHHKVSYENLPTFNCQQINTECQPHFTANCNTCIAKPRSNVNKMLSQIKHYFSAAISFEYIDSLFTIKSKLKANYIDDGRPTEISILQEKPPFYCIFAGKINSIYEIEKILN